MDEQKPDEPIFQLKDIGILLPVLSSALAITWEVGRFIPTEGFFLFTLSEHIVAAISALPFALFAAVIVLTASIPSFSMRRIRKKQPGNSKGFQWIPHITIVILCSVLFWFAYNAESVFLYCFAACGIIFVAAALGTADRSVMNGTLLLIVLTLALAAGIDTSRLELNSNSNRVITVKTIGGPIIGWVMMAGENGLLIYRRENASFIFIKADQVVSMEYQRPTYRKSPPT